MTSETEPLAANFRYPPSADFPTGPDIGERLPEIILPDQRGQLLDVEQARANRRALIVFHRSLRW